MPNFQPQRHHFIPRFILRKFAPNEQPPAGPAGNQQHAKRRRRDYLVNKIDLDDGILTQRPVSTEFALVDMYRDPGFDENPYHLEDKLSKLESAASEVLRKASDTFASNPILTLTRAEVDTLRKFLFLMKYRNGGMFDRYNHDDVKTYDADDRVRMIRYMRKKGFAKPRDVWFHNLKHMLDVEMDAAKTWQNTLPKRIYPDDAKMFEFHLLYSFMSFCQPQSQDEEFLLTENAFAIFEGPSSVKHDVLSGKTQPIVYTEYHNFAPVSPKLIIILRSRFLPFPGDKGGDQELRRRVVEQLRAMHLDPARAGSVLEDLPVRPCKTIYVNPEITSSSSFTRNDVFQFLCYKLLTTHVAMVNNIFLEEGYSTSSIVYRSPVHLRAVIENYLSEQTQGLKQFVDRPGDKQRAYLDTLEKVLRTLGGSAKCKIHPLDLSKARIYVHRALRLGFFVGLKLLESQKSGSLPPAYCLLRPGEVQAFSLKILNLTECTGATRTTFWDDVDQASRLMMLETKVDRALHLSNLTPDEKDLVRAQRQEFFMTFPPERLWLYFKISRNMERCDIDDTGTDLPEPELEGVEDNYAEAIAMFPDQTKMLVRRMFMHVTMEQH
ncbi:hypothetical protein BJY04DRAFT_222390 [Aspergillus karnatakaensis]|uniref:DUF4238 domain-containing protein n=1 Tax=Aspergillus karnatakaensis TaxID=1810916 RepID=UPI003CCD60F5